MLGLVGREGGVTLLSGGAPAGEWDRWAWVVLLNFNLLAPHHVFSAFQAA